MRTTARSRFIIGPAIATSVSSRRRWVQVVNIHRHGLPPANKRRAEKDDDQRKLPLSRISSMCTMGLSETRPCKRARVVPALPSDPRMRKLMKRQENDQTQIPNQSGYDAIHFHRLDGSKNRLCAKGKTERRWASCSRAELMATRMFDILSAFEARHFQFASSETRFLY